MDGVACRVAAVSRAAARVTGPVSAGYRCECAAGGERGRGLLAGVSDVDGMACGVAVVSRGRAGLRCGGW